MPPDLIVYPTSLALRQHQRRTLEERGFVDARYELTLAALIQQCAEAAARAGLLRNPAGQDVRPISDLDRELSVVTAVSRFLDRPPFELRALGRLSPSALEETLALLLNTVSPLADRAEDFVQRLEADAAPKNRELAALYRTYAAVCHDLGVADRVRTHAAVLELLRADRALWPAGLRDAGAVRFVAVRWVGPFMESFARALHAALGRESVSVHHILADYEQDWWGGSLLCQAGTLLFDRAGPADPDWREFQPEATTAAVAQLLSLREGLAMNDAALAAESRERVGFSCSVGLYGEVEDLARRIAWALQDRTPRLRPAEIALVVRDLGAYGDAIVDVFSRFGIPFFVRRGQPALGVPVVKTMLGFARLSAERSRETFCALLESPWVDWGPLLGGDRAARGAAQRLADDIRRCGVEPVIADAAALHARLLRHYAVTQRCAAADAQRRADRAVHAFERALGDCAPASWSAGLEDLLARCKEFGIEQRVRHWLAAGEGDGGALERRAYLLNAKAYSETGRVVRTLQKHALLESDGERAGWLEIVSALSRALANVTVAAAPPDESGVWILNPYDVAGLQFKLVLVAGLNDGVFPGLPLQDPLFSDRELEEHRAQMSAAGFLPRAALAASRVRHSQENLLFLTTLAAAAESLVLSYASHDESGGEQTPSVFFRTVWRLAGWPAYGDAMPALPPDEYDRWRLGLGVGHFPPHWEHLHARERGANGRELPVIAPHLRKPFPGESFMATVPLALCRAADEARQRLALQGSDAATTRAHGCVACDADLAAAIVRGIAVERERGVFMTQLAVADDAGAALPGTTPGNVYSGVLPPRVWESIRPPVEPVHDFSTTELESLAACPYKYYLERILGLQELETNELEARPMDFGTAVHRILFLGFRFLQGRPPDDAPGSALPSAAPFRDLVRPAWAVPEGNTWRLQFDRQAGAAQALPLVDLDPRQAARILELFDAVAEDVRAWAVTGQAGWMLGAPEQLRVEWQRIRRCVRAVVRATLEPAEYRAGRSKAFLDGLRRFPALLEYEFNSGGSRPAEAASVVLADPANPARQIRVHGKVDRLDLLFDDDGALRAVVVIDYKGRSKASLKPAELAEAIAAARNCQLPVYGLAAAERFGSGVPILTQYLTYYGNTEEILKLSRANWMALDGAPVPVEALAALCGTAPDLLQAFRTALFAAVDRLERGEFVVHSEECEYCGYRGCCRYSPRTLPADASGEGGAA